MFHLVGWRRSVLELRLSHACLESPGLWVCWHLRQIEKDEMRDSSAICLQGERFESSKGNVDRKTSKTGNGEERLKKNTLWFWCEIPCIMLSYNVSSPLVSSSKSLVNSHCSPMLFRKQFLLGRTKVIQNRALKLVYIKSDEKRFWWCDFNVENYLLPWQPHMDHNLYG
jgi:hypothetical protein